jgi:hypothetical protein
MLQCYVLTCGRSVTAFLAPPRSQRPGQGPRSPHPKAGPAHLEDMCASICSRSYTLCYLKHFVIARPCIACLLYVEPHHALVDD